MKKMFFLAMIFSLWGCNHTRPIEFNEEIWKNNDPIFISPERYGMALWLKENYHFCGKSYDEITMKLGTRNPAIMDSLTHVFKIRYLIKQHNNNFIIGIDPPSDMAYLVIYFKEDIVIKASIKERKNKNDAFVETDIVCTKSSWK
jgi:hypothetical protein